MSASQAMMMFVEIVHLESIELIRDFFDNSLLLWVWIIHIPDTLSVPKICFSIVNIVNLVKMSLPFDVSSWRRFILAISFDSPTGLFACVYIAHHRARHVDFD